MALGTYGTKRPADVSPSDIEVLVVYMTNRNDLATQEITRYPGTSVITPVMHNTNTGGNTVEILGGLYNLTLPANAIQRKGYYSVYIRPVQIRAKIYDCGNLATYPDVYGIVFNTQTAPVEFYNKFQSNGLNGYRIEYLNNDGTKILNTHRIITSSFLVEAVSENNTNTIQKSITYRYNTAGTLLFCTLTPNIAPSFKPDATPFVGLKGQNIIITNTDFNPIVLDIEMVDYDVESLAIALYGDQLKTIDDGVYTIFDFDGNIYSQYDLYEIRNGENEKLAEVRKRRADDNIDTTKRITNI